MQHICDTTRSKAKGKMMTCNKYVINKQLFSHQLKIQLNAMQAGFYTQPKQLNNNSNKQNI